MPTIIALLPHGAHAALEAAIEGTADRVYRAGSRATSRLVAPARGTGSVCPLIWHREREGALWWVRRQELEALRGLPRAIGGGHDGGAGRGCSIGSGMGGQGLSLSHVCLRTTYFGLSLVGYSKERKAQISEGRVKRRHVQRCVRLRRARWS
jgi:hypothetical protein